MQPVGADNFVKWWECGGKQSEQINNLIMAINGQKNGIIMNFGNVFWAGIKKHKKINKNKQKCVNKFYLQLKANRVTKAF